MSGEDINFESLLARVKNQIRKLVDLLMKQISHISQLLDAESKEATDQVSIIKEKNQEIDKIKTQLSYLVQCLTDQYVKKEDDKYSQRIFQLQEKFITCTELILNQKSSIIKSAVDDEQSNDMEFEQKGRNIQVNQS